jgi:hypothetical protein
MMQTDVSSAYKAGTGSVYGGPTRVRGVFIDLSGAGTLELSDGASGSVLFKITTAASPTQNPVYVPIPGEGIRFYDSVYTKTATNVTSVTVFYG